MSKWVGETDYLRPAPELHFCIIEVMWALLRNCALWTLLCRKMHFNGTLSQRNSQTKHLKNKILFNELDPKIEEEWHFSWPRAMQHVGCARGRWAACKRSAWDAFSTRVVIIIMIVIIININRAIIGIMLITIITIIAFIIDLKQCSKGSLALRTIKDYCISAWIIQCLIFPLS